jgi:hypothetical protein
LEFSERLRLNRLSLGRNRYFKASSNIIFQGILLPVRLGAGELCRLEEDSSSRDQKWPHSFEQPLDDREQRRETAADLLLSDGLGADAVTKIGHGRADSPPPDDKAHRGYEAQRNSYPVQHLVAASSFEICMIRHKAKHYRLLYQHFGKGRWGLSVLSKSNECGKTLVYDGLQIRSFRKKVNSATRGIDNPSMLN